MVVKPRSAKSTRQQGSAPSEARQGILPGLFPESGALPALSGIPFLVGASPQSSTFTWLSHCVSASLRGHLLIRTPVTLDQEPALFQGDLILANYICNDPISK